MSHADRQRRRPGGARRKRRGAVPDAAGRGGSRHLFRQWHKVAGRLRAARRLILFLDFDGTLAEIRSRPEQVRLPDSTRVILSRLARHPRVTVWIVSGRRLADLRRRVNVPGVRCAGLYGWERPGNSSYLRLSQPLLRRVKGLLARRLRDLRGVRLEDKGSGFSVHYRGAKSDIARRVPVVLRITLAPFKQKLRLLKGKKVWEVLPKEMEGKGPAVRGLLGQGRKPVLPICVGDDAADEPAFDALRRGITVRVGRRPGRARFYLRNPKEVASFLEWLEAEAG